MKLLLLNNYFIAPITKYVSNNKRKAATNNLINRVLIHAATNTPVEEDSLVDTLRAIITLGFDRYYIDILAQYVPIKGKCLDVGCGSCWYAPFLLTEGASHYVGIDLGADYDAKTVHNNYGWHDLPISIGKFLSFFPNVNYLKVDFNDFNGEGGFDTITLFTVTEHLESLDRCFNKISDLLNPDGYVFITHHNFYCWTGHHCSPNTVSQYDPSNSAMLQLADWNHILNKDLLDTRRLQLNCIRIHELLYYIDKYFVIEKLDKHYSLPEHGGDRMSPEIRGKLLTYYDDELLIDRLTITCRKRIQSNPRTKIEAIIPLVIDRTTTKQINCYLIPVPLGINADEYRLFEDAIELKPAFSLHEDIRLLGNGRYSIWPPLVYMSTSDNSDPVTNGRIYNLKRCSKHDNRP